MTVTTLTRAIPKLSLFRLMRASGAFEFKFDDLGIEIECSGFSAGSFRGVAEVTYWNSAEEGLSWFVGDITLECHKWNGGGTGSGAWDVKHITLEQDDRLYVALWSELTDGALKDTVDAAVQGQLG